MNDECSLVNGPAVPRCTLEERLAQRPALLARLHALADHLDQSVADGSDAHRAEEWVRAQHPQASAHGKKNS